MQWASLAYSQRSHGRRPNALTAAHRHQLMGLSRPKGDRAWIASRSRLSASARLISRPNGSIPVR